MSDGKEQPPIVLYRIRGWDHDFENNRSREVKDLDWLKRPLRIGSEEWIWLLDHPNGAAHLGVWYAVTELAARCRPRGTLMRFNGTPHTPESISKAAGLTALMCGEGVARLVTLGWIEQISFTQHAVNGGSTVPSSPQEHRTTVPTTPHHTAQRARGGEGTGLENTPPLPPSTEGGSDSSSSQHRRQPRGMTKGEQLAADIRKRAKEGTL